MRPAAILFSAVLAAPAAAQTTVDQRRPAAPEGLVDIENMAGSIRVTGWDKPEVAVSGKLGRRASALQLSGGEDRTRIEVEAEGSPHGVRSDLDIKVPAGSRLRIEGFEASITITGVTGSVEAETVNGTITLAGGTREVELQAVNGGVEIARASGRIKAESVNGPVTVRDSSGELEASTVNGPLVVTGGNWDRVRIETVSGSLRFEAALPKHAALEAETVSGSVELVLPSQIAADFSISSFSGDIDNEFGPAPTRESRWTSEKHLGFSVGGGGTRVSVQTLSGNIHLRKRP
ncbi:MAG TPA: DUF4097 family beta strand repeat-containing protein [Vicinamibacteria bacterium]|nr:DUF4097 family beta strand repeat-containing protein [Vicinamibacteria bacterium]